MKTKRYKKTKDLFKKVLSNFALYGLIPLICGGFLGLFIFIRAKGAPDATETFARIENLTLSTVIGGGTVREEKTTGFYFHSGEILFPMYDSQNFIIGGGKYFHIPEKKPEEEKKQENTPSSLPENAVPIISCDLSSPSPYINTTKYSIDVEEARNSLFPSETKVHGNDPLVLVLHTHGTESYFEDSFNLSGFASGEIKGYFIQGETTFRTDDPKKSVVQVGKVFSDTLIAEGIPTVHCTVMHDKDDFNDAYANSAETVQKMLKEYPSIQYVIDLHRDSVVRGDSYVKSLTQIENTPTAQVMAVVGTNQNGRHPNWEQNLIVAVGFKDAMDALYPTLARSLYLRTSRFNQEFLPGCILLEVGSCGNTLEEAETAAKFSAKAFAHMLKTRQ